MGTGTFWLVLILAPLLAVLPDLFIKIYKTLFHPSIVDKVMS
jgi:hypothetical protein